MGSSMQILCCGYSVYQRRKFYNSVALSLSFCAVVLTLLVFLWLLESLLHSGLSAINIAFFTESSPPPGVEEGGLANAIVGSAMIVGSATAVSTPIGIAAAVYLSEFGRNSYIARVTRFVSDVMLSVPSIVIGLFVYMVAVSKVGHFSGWAGALSLGLIAVPVVMRSTENMLKMVSPALREAACALGAPRWRVAMSIMLCAARSGVVTGCMLSVARLSGETAPLLFTALNNQFFSMDMSKPMASLPVMIYQFAMSPYKYWQELAWGGAFFLSFFVLSINIVARVFFRKSL